MRFTRIATVGALLVLVPLALGWGEKGGPPEKSEIEKVIEVVKLAYDGASKPESAVVMVELAIFDMGKKGKIKDAPAQLERILAQTRKPALRNFTRFLIAAAHGERGEDEKALEVLQAIAAENAPRVGAGDPPAERGEAEPR